ncbi:MAG: acyltransferase [Gorillibacterium sp.]|nr:acyltransferase [Gorillibacterium sp.]
MKRYESLDSLRGLAALAVMVGHFFLVFPFMGQNTTSWGFINYPINFLKYTPLHIIWAGHEAVIMFFLLSGLVLALPYTDGKKPAYGIYLVKRICRIYLPYAAAVLLAVLAKEAFFHAPLTGLSGYFNSQWTTKTTFSSLLDHATFLGNFNSTVYDPILWSLIHEMRISIIFPLLVLIVVKGGWKLTLPVCAALSVTAQFLLDTLQPRFMTNHVVTIHYISFFLIGALIAKYRHELIQVYSRLSKWMIICLIGAAVLAYTNKWLFYGADWHRGTARFYLEDWIIALGAVVFIWLALASPLMQKPLSSRPVLFLGRTSYSLYLYHFVVLLSFLHILRDKIPVPVILALAFGVSFAAAAAGYYGIEKPGMRLGRWLTSHRSGTTKQAVVNQSTTM